MLRGGQAGEEGDPQERVRQRGEGGLWTRSMSDCNAPGGLRQGGQDGEATVYQVIYIHMNCLSRSTITHILIYLFPQGTRSRPKESCDFHPQKICNMATTLVPYLARSEECVDVPKEVFLSSVT